MPSSLRSLSIVAASLALSLGPGCNAGTSGGSDDGGTFTRLPDGRVISTRDGALPPGTCAITQVSTTRVIPTVVVVVDQSGSMTENFGGTDRWNALRNALLDDDGLIKEFENSVRFGIALYTGLDDDPSVPVECPHISSITPAMMNFDAIREMYADERPLQETPTGDALDAILDDLLAIPDPDPDPTIFILATDGEPDTCEVPNPQNGQAEALAAVRRGYRSGIRTFLLSVGREISEAHMQDMANAGIGRDSGDAPYWVAGDDVGLRTALRSIIAGEVSCTLELAGRIDPAQACEGSVVEMTGRGELECNTDWRAVDETHIEILGDACEEFLTSRGATIDAQFPCNVILI
ncbi:vWA domain-containing protein [Sandaracinus amylolyticus]|uniref:vWA domain-containing protein n=1 Tax=Sandaracinus amylolyticus TaxID=927083 RepID=UPI001F47F60A|nr:vWA domain-containing protein [Sandaracinus amylolyticus]UJR86333.1 Hypothetical protein I5071_84270 [Sandaracinus amylolyticus]